MTETERLLEAKATHLSRQLKILEQENQRLRAQVRSLQPSPTFSVRQSVSLEAKEQTQ